MRYLPNLQTLLSTRWIGPKGIQPQAICLVLHGQGDRMASYHQIQEELDLPHFAFLLVQAPLAYLQGHQWYRDNRFRAEDRARVRVELMTIVQQLINHKPDWANSMFVLGHSQGANTALDLALHGTYSFRGVIAISGYTYPDMTTSEPKTTPILFTHGRQDTEVPWEPTYQQAKVLSKQGHQVTYISLPNKGHEVDEDLELPIIRQWMLDLKPFAGLTDHIGSRARNFHWTFHRLVGHQQFY